MGHVWESRVSANKVGSRIAKAALIVIGALVGIVVVALVVLNIVYPWEYVYRVLAWQESDVNDYRYNFPQRRLEAATSPHPFEVMLDMERVAYFSSNSPASMTWSGTWRPATPRRLSWSRMGPWFTSVISTTPSATRRSPPSRSPNRLSRPWSVSLSIKGTWTGVDDPITQYLPELAERDPRFADISIRHLLLMASGLEYEEMRPFLFNGDDPLTTYYPDQRQLALENTNIIDPPGRYFQYNKYHPQLLGMIIERATGEWITKDLHAAHALGAVGDGVRGRLKLAG